MLKYQYYTPIELAYNILKNILPKGNYATIIDICSGSWNLLKAAKRLYPDSYFVGVDIDNKSIKHRIDNADFYCEDGRIFAVKSRNQKQTYELILSNPPFGYLADDERILFNCKQELAYSSLINKRFENEMMVANMLLANNKSILFAILPSTFIEGSSNKKGRIEIAKEFGVIAIVKLPNDTFGNKRLSTCAIVLQKKFNKKTKFYEAKTVSKWRIEYKGEISRDFIRKGFWSTGNLPRQLDNLGAEILRGNISSALFSKRGCKVLHCSSRFVDNSWVPSQRYCKKSSIKNKMAVTVAKNDILINRIGKYAGYWSINKQEDMLISDCIIAIKTNGKHQEIENILEKNSLGNRNLLNIQLRGVSTPYITAEDIKRILSAERG